YPPHLYGGVVGHVCLPKLHPVESSGIVLPLSVAEQEQGWRRGVRWRGGAGAAARCAMTWGAGWRGRPAGQSRRKGDGVA
ncbi:unnamed protein product, partial [Urochloa humidicola]